MIEGKNIFITGGAGFIGSTLVGKLIDKNKVVVYDSLLRDALKNKSFKNHPNLTVIQGDVMDYEHMSRSMKGSQVIVHCAAIAGVDFVMQMPVQTMRVNMVGSVNALEAASKLDNCERVLCFSTSEVFGTHAWRPSEGDRTSIGRVGEARWTYAVSKLAEEHLAIAYHQQYGLPATVVRPFNTYGPGQLGNGALTLFIERAVRNETLYVNGDGTQIRAWCYVDDMVEGIMCAMSHPNAVGESFNIGNQRAVTTIYGLVNTVVRVLNSKSKIEFTYKDYVDVELRVPSVKKARDLIGFEAKVDLEEGIAMTGAHYRNQ